MAYRILTQLFADRELRLVRYPISAGCPKKTTQPEEDNFISSDHVYASAPQYGGGGGLMSMGISTQSETLDSTLEFVQRSDSDLRNRVYGRKAREKLRRVGYASEYLYPVAKDWWFLTLTYPTESTEGCNAIADHSGWIVKQLKNYLRKYEEKTSTYLYCWERQKRGTLHLHYSVYLPAAGRLGFSSSEFKRWAISHVHQLASISNAPIWVNKWGRDWSECPQNLQAYAQPVEKSISRYLAKYVSKTAGKNSHKWASLSSPKRWTGYSRDLSGAVDELTIESRQDFNGYLQARNAFEFQMSKLKLTHPNSIVYYNRLADCDGETFSLFKELPCPRLKKFLETCRKSLKACIPMTNSTNSSQASWSIAQVSDMKNLLKLLQNPPKSVKNSAEWSEFCSLMNSTNMTEVRALSILHQDLMSAGRCLLQGDSRSVSRSTQAVATWRREFRKSFLVVARECGQNRASALLICQSLESWRTDLNSVPKSNGQGGNLCQGELSFM